MIKSTGNDVTLLFSLGTAAYPIGNIKIGTGAGEINLQGTDKVIENKVKDLADGLLQSIGWHLYFHIINKVGREFAIWAGPTNQEPPTNWWEETFP